MGRHDHGQAVTTLGFGLINTKQKVDSAKALYNSAGQKDILGVVLHENTLKWYDCEKEPGVVDYSMADMIWEICREYNTDGMSKKVKF
jgi:GH35 family endo-1,4-beta-xylanase